MGLSTGKINKLVELVRISEKNIEDFKYESTVAAEGYKYGLITFKEKQNDN